MKADGITPSINTGGIKIDSSRFVRSIGSEPQSHIVMGTIGGLQHPQSPHRSISKTPQSGDVKGRIAYYILRVRIAAVIEQKFDASVRHLYTT
ncbi:unnamed protein product [Sphagnum jensenii]|uniref:Uncharacterized protein n=1 Tax=Sphagnum jensenii TaxID=128206 RepID=A0ABP0VIC1_9BRYO